MVGGFGEAGSPIELLHALVDSGAKDLTVVSNNAGNGQVGIAALLANAQVRKLVCSFPKGAHSTIFSELYRNGQIELELVPQGTLAERIRAAGAGIGAFYTPTGVGTSLANGKEQRTFRGREYLLEHPLFADYALVKCDRADVVGNLAFSKTARNFNPIMCTAARWTVVQAREVGHAGTIDPEHIVTPGIYVDAVVEVPEPLHERWLVENQHRIPPEMSG